MKLTKLALAASTVSSLLAAGLARASESTGTEGVAEMNITGAQFGMMVGGIAVLGLVVWGVSKITSK